MEEEKAAKDAKKAPPAKGKAPAPEPVKEEAPKELTEEEKIK